MFAKEMTVSEFKYEVAGVLADTLAKLRYPQIHQYSTDVERKAAKNYDMMLDAFNLITNSEVGAANAAAPTRVKQWWDVNQAAFSKADKELAEKYKKEDEGLK